MLKKPSKGINYTLVNIGIVVAILAIIVSTTFAMIAGVRAWKLKSELHDTQLEHQRLLMEQIGKPQVVEQRYIRSDE